MNFTGIDAACGGLNYEVAYKVSDDGGWVKDATGTVASAGGQLSVAVPAAVDVQDITEFALTIYGE